MKYLQYMCVCVLRSTKLSLGEMGGWDGSGMFGRDGGKN